MNSTSCGSRFVSSAARSPALAMTEGKIVLEDIRHHYGRGSGGLQGVSLTIRPGEKIGVVGFFDVGRVDALGFFSDVGDWHAGAGLGLPLARGYAEAHGGSISLRNQPPGLEVTVQLPRQTPAAL